MERKDISIIVPVYNAEGYLGDCLTSICMQSFQDWECICVDDGSRDRSSEIVEAFASKDSRFRLIRQENGGPGMARNAGLEAAHGQFFSFVDSDDLLHPEILQRLLGLIEMFEADLAVCSYFRFEKNKQFQSFAGKSKQLKVEGQGYLYTSPILPEMVDGERFRVQPWGKLYNRDRHGDLRFPALHGPEDVYASFDVYAKSNRTVISPSRLYGYRILESALTYSASKYRNYIKGYAEVATHGEKVFSTNGVGKQMTARVVRPYIMRIFFLLYEMLDDARLSKEEKKDLLGLANHSLRKIKRDFAGRQKAVPYANYLTYGAVCFRSLPLLIFWQWVRRHVLLRITAWSGALRRSGKPGPSPKAACQPPHEFLDKP